MSQTYAMERSLNVKYAGHKHKLHFIILEDCDVEDRHSGAGADDCPKLLDNGDADRLFEVIQKAIGFTDGSEAQ